MTKKIDIEPFERIREKELQSWGPTKKRIRVVAITTAIVGSLLLLFFLPKMYWLIRLLLIVLFIAATLVAAVIVRHEFWTRIEMKIAGVTKQERKKWLKKAKTGLNI